MPKKTMLKKPTTRPRAKRPDVADLVAAVLRHPDLPPPLWDAITDELCRLNDSTDVYENPEVLREIFRLTRRRAR